MDEGQIADRLTAIEERLRRLESAFSPVAPPLHASLPKVPAPPAGDATESRVGRLLFGVLAAGLLSLALITLTSYLLARGLITPRMQYGLAWAAVAALAVGGDRLRGSSATVGTILTGLASLGAYLTAAGGQATFRLYGDETTLALTLAVAGANVLYGATRAAPAFVLLGLIGGTTAAVMVERYGLGTAIALATGLAAGYTSLRREWPAMAWTSYAAGAIGLVFAAGTLSYQDAWNWFGYTAYLFPLLAFSAIATWSLQTLAFNGDHKYDISLLGTNFSLPRGVPAFIAALALTYSNSRVFSTVTGVASFLIALGWGAFCLAWSRRTEAGGRRSFLVAAFIAGGVAPVLTIKFPGDLEIWLALATLSAIESIAGKGRLLLAGGGWLILSSLSFDTLIRWNFTIVGVSAILAVVLLVARYRHKAASLWPDLAFALLSIGLYVFHAANEAGQALGVESPTPGFVAAAFVSLVIGAVMRRPGARYAGWILSAAGAGSVLLNDLDGLDALARLVVLVLFGIGALAAAAFYARRAPAPPPVV